MSITCGWCLEQFTAETYCLHNCRNKEQPKMTREEAIELAKTFGNKYPWYEDSIRLLEALGLIKFDEPKTNVLFEFKDNNCNWTGRYRDISDKHGTIRLEEWSEGLVLWVGGEIVWKGWEKYYKKGDAVTIEYYDGLRHEKQKQAGIIA